jgi:hypothetical protein
MNGRPGTNGKVVLVRTTVGPEGDVAYRAEGTDSGCYGYAECTHGARVVRCGGLGGPLRHLVEDSSTSSRSTEDLE